MPIYDSWKLILETARYTPSPHNVQPWKLRVIDQKTAQLFIDRNRMLPDEDLTGSFIYSAMGMFLEALSIIGKNHQQKIHYELLNDNKEGRWIPFALLTMESDISNHQSEYLDEIFLKRRTSRLASLPTPILQEVLEKITRLAQMCGQNFNCFTDPKIISEVIEANITALFEDLNSPHYHDEIVSWFRYTQKEGRSKKDGLEARCMNLNPLEFYFTAKFPWILKLPISSHLMRGVYRKKIGAMYSLGIISGAFWTKEEAIVAGKFLLRFWLELAKHDVFIHPMGNLVTNLKARQWLEERTQIKNIWLVFRMGYTKPAPQSHRLDVNDLFLE